jgi:hypothetical protein
MTETSRPTSTIEQWTSVQAYTLAVICLLVGIAGGWFIRGSASPSTPIETASASAPAMGNAGAVAQTPTPAEMQKMADTQAGPLIEKLKPTPKTPDFCKTLGTYTTTPRFSPRRLSTISAL